jgi:hypothetical protein
MKDLILITSYCNTPEKENTLRKLVSNIKKEKEFFDLMVVSHLPIPIDISQKTDFCLYDKKNEILLDWNMRSTPWFNPGDERPILSCFTGFFNIHLAIWRMLILGNSIAKNCGYKKVHHLEYDCEICDFSELKENSDLLNDFDAVTYNKKEQTVDPILFGTYQSYNIDGLHQDLLNLNEDKIKKEIFDSEHKSAEKMFYDLLNHRNNVFVKNKSLLDLNGNKFGLSHNELSNRNTAWCLPYYDELTEKLGFVVWNSEQIEKDISVKIIYNDNQIIDFGIVKPKHWLLRDIDDYVNAKKLIVLLNDNVRDVFDFEKNNEEFKKVSYRQKEKR